MRIQLLFLLTIIAIIGYATCNNMNPLKSSQDPIKQSENQHPEKKEGGSNGTETISEDDEDDFEVCDSDEYEEEMDDEEFEEYMHRVDHSFIMRSADFKTDKEEF